MRTVVLWDRVPVATTREVRSLRNAKQPARTSEHQTNVRSAGRLTIAIMTPLNMALAPVWKPLYATPAYTKRRAYRHLLCARGGAIESFRKPIAWALLRLRRTPAVSLGRQSCA